MRVLFLVGCLVFAMSQTPQIKAFELRPLVDSLFSQPDVFGTEDEDARPITWDDLTPPLSPEARAAAEELNSSIDTMTDAQITRALELIDQNGGTIIEAMDDQVVSIEGYLVPLDFEATEAKTFVLVPFLGACIHVPPPPPNQIVFIEFEDGLPMEAMEENLWTPFRVTGTLRADPKSTDLADVGYQMVASSMRVTPFSPLADQGTNSTW